MRATALASEWSDFLKGVLENFLETDNENTKAQEIRKVLNDLVKNSQLVNFNAPKPRIGTRSLPVQNMRNFFF